LNPTGRQVDKSELRPYDFADYLVAGTKGQRQSTPGRTLEVSSTASGAAAHT
jgi:hypothetical protein